jgi:hypothetical protein
MEGAFLLSHCYGCEVILCIFSTGLSHVTQNLPTSMRRLSRIVTNQRAVVASFMLRGTHDISVFQI